MSRTVLVIPATPRRALLDHHSTRQHRRVVIEKRFGQLGWPRQPIEIPGSIKAPSFAYLASRNSFGARFRERQNGEEEEDDRQKHTEDLRRRQGR